MIRRLKRSMRKPLAYLIVGGFLVLVVILASSLFSGSNEAEGPPLQVQRVEDPEHAADDFQIVVPEDRIPTTMDERMTTAPLSLLPNHAGFPEARGEVTLPARDREEIGRDLEKALSTWETYLPSDGHRDRYRKRIEPLVAADSLEALVERRDSNDAPGVCPQTYCLIGSQWYRKGAISWFVIDSSVDQVYIVAYGAVLYRGDPDADSRAGGSSDRSYGVIMRRGDNKWLLERVAAESLR